jgi:hypothetical protein
VNELDIHVFEKGKLIPANKFFKEPVQRISEWMDYPKELSATMVCLDQLFLFINRRNLKALKDQGCLQFTLTVTQK